MAKAGVITDIADLKSIEAQKAAIEKMLDAIIQKIDKINEPPASSHQLPLKPSSLMSNSQSCSH